MDQVQNLLGRPKEYYNVDGVGELSIGFMCLGFALLGWLQLHAPRGSAWAWDVRIRDLYGGDAGHPPLRGQSH